MPITEATIQKIALKVFNQQFAPALRRSKLNMSSINNDVGYTTIQDVKDNYLSIEWFNSLFNAVDSNGDPILPNDGNTSNIDSIKAMFGFWTEQYISALGQGTGGGGGGGTLAGLADVSLSDLQDGDILVYDSATTHWVNQQPSSSIDMTTVWNALAGSTNEQINASHLADALTGYVTSTALATTLADYVTATSLATTLADYVTTSGLTTTLADYVTTSGLATTLADYVTSTSLATTLANYVTSTALATTLADYVTATSLATTLADYGTKTWIGQNYVSIAFFNRLFQAFAPVEQGATEAEQVEPNDLTTTIDNIKAMFGLWTEEYISALGLGSGGGGISLNEPLSSINSAALGTPSQANVAIVWNGTAWTYGTTMSSVSWNDITGKPTTLAGYGITDAYISNGTITLGANSITPVTSLSGYATESWVGQNYLGINATAAAATKLATARTIWGQSFDGSANVTGELSGVSGVKFSNNGCFALDAYGNFKASTNNDSNYWNVYRYDGSSALAVKASSGNVGINTTTPAYKLDVNGSINGTSVYYNGNACIHAGNIGSQSVDYANSAGSVAWSNVSGRPTNVSSFTNDAGYYKSGDYIYAKNIYITEYLHLKDNSNNWISTIDHSGNAPIFGYGQGVNGYNVYYTGRNVAINGGSTWNATNGIYINSSNNIGIGKNSNIFTKLDIEGAAKIVLGTGSTTINTDVYGLNIGTNGDRIKTTDAYYTGIAFNHLLQHSNSDAYRVSPQAWIGTRLTSTSGSELAALVFATKEGTGTDIPTEKMCITPDGKVGINTKNPSRYLEIYSEGSPSILLHNNGGDLGIEMQTNNQSYYNWIVAAQYNVANAFEITPSTSTSSTSYTTPILLVKAGGYVGINTNAPSYALDISGSLRTTKAAKFGNVMIGGNSLNSVDTDGCIELLTGTGYIDWHYNGSSADYTTRIIERSSGVLTLYGSISATGGVSALSDIRHKDILNDTTIKVEDIARMRSVAYRWADGRGDNETHVGSIAQDWQSVLPEVVMRANDAEGTLSLQYGVAALISSITIARKVVNHEERITELEKECERLRTENEMLKLKVA